MTISVTLDTNNVNNPSSAFFQNAYAANTATFSISGVGAGTLTNSGIVTLNRNAFGGIVGISTMACSTVLSRSMITQSVRSH